MVKSSLFSYVKSLFLFLFLPLKTYGIQARQILVTKLSFSIKTSTSRIKMLEQIEIQKLLLGWGDNLRKYRSKLGKLKHLLLLIEKCNCLFPETADLVTNPHRNISNFCRIFCSTTFGNRFYNEKFAPTSKVWLNILREDFLIYLPLYQQNTNNTTDNIPLPKQTGIHRYTVIILEVWVLVRVTGRQLS